MENKRYTTGSHGSFPSEVEGHQALYGQQSLSEMQDLITPLVDEESRWAHAHTGNEYDYFHPIPITTNYLGMGVPASMPLAYQHPITTSDLLYGNLPAPTYHDSAYQQASFTAPSSSTSSEYSLQSTAYYSPSNLGPPTSMPIGASPMTTPTSSAYSKSPSPAPAGRSSGAGGSSSRSHSVSQSSTAQANDLNSYGILNSDTRTWSCAYPNCSSKAVFIRPCDLRKHFHRHSKNFFCRYEGCPRANEGGFSNKKDRARHESSHNPGVQCDWDGCERIFSRVDNMRNHLARIHHKQRHS